MESDNLNDPDVRKVQQYFFRNKDTGNELKVESVNGYFFNISILDADENVLACVGLSTKAATMVGNRLLGEIGELYR